MATKHVDVEESRAYVGYLIPSITALSFMITSDNEKKELYSSIQTELKGEGWMKDILCKENNIPDQYDAAKVVDHYLQYPVTRISKNICVKDKESKQSIILRFKNGRDYVYVPNQIHAVGPGESEIGGTSLNYDFVESGFFDEESWLNYEGDNPTFEADFDKIKFDETPTDDRIFDLLKKWVIAMRTSGKFLPGIGMFDPYRGRIDSFMFTNHPGEDNHYPVMRFPDIDRLDWRESLTANTKALESLWVYREALNDRGWSKWLYFPTFVIEDGVNRYNYMIDKTTPASGFIIINPQSKGYITYDHGFIKVNLYKSIDQNTGSIEEYDLGEKISMAKSILMGEYAWVNTMIDNLGDMKFGSKALNMYNSYKACLDEINLVLELWEGHISIFESIPLALSDNHLSLNDLFEPDCEGVIGNQHLLQQVVRSGNLTPIPEVFKDIDFDFSAKSDSRIIYYKEDSLYSLYGKYMNLDYSELERIIFRDEKVLDSLKNKKGWLNSNLSKIEVDYQMPSSGLLIDLNLISNLPNVTPEDLRDGKFMYREVIKLTKTKCLARDVWFETRDTDHIEWVLSWIDPEDEEDYGEPQFDDESLTIILKLIKEKIVDYADFSDEDASVIREFAENLK